MIFVLEDAILATDLAIYFRRRSETFAVIDDGALDWGSDAHRSLLRGMMMTGCDLSAITKPWPIQQKERYLMKSTPKGGVHRGFPKRNLKGRLRSIKLHAEKGSGGVQQITERC